MEDNLQNFKEHVLQADNSLLVKHVFSTRQGSSEHSFSL